MATKKKEEEKEIIVSLNIKTVKVPIVGVSPLIVNRFDPKMKQQIEDNARAAAGLKQGGKKKNIADPKEDYEQSLYRFADGKTCGFPAVAFKAAMVTGAYRAYGKPQTISQFSFHVIADDPATGLVKINGEHIMREDMVRVGTINKVASPRYRGCFPSWSAVLTIQFLADTFSESEIFNIVNAAGFGCGVGEWRPEKAKSGSYGLFRVANS